MCSGDCVSNWISLHSTDESEINSCGSSLEVVAVASACIDAGTICTWQTTFLLLTLVPRFC